MKLHHTLYTTLLLATSLPSLAAEEKVLNIYNWNDYIGKNTVARFEKETGIKVKYDVYDSNETLQAKLLTGHSGYDLVFPSLEFAGKQINSGVHRPVDKKQLTNYGNLNPILLQKLTTVDPGNKYLVPYMWFTTGIGINEDKVKKALGGDLPTDMWRLAFDPTYTSKLKSCGISYMDTPSDMFTMANIYLGKGGTDYSKDTLATTTAALAKVRKDVRVFNSSPIDLLANGDVCLAVAYSGDVYMARNRAVEAKNGQKIRFVIPNKGTLMSLDSMVIPKDAKHPDNALKFINFMLKPDVIADATNEVFYANANDKATPFVSKEIVSDPNIYIPDALKVQLVAKKVIKPEEQRLLTDFYTKFKSSK
ncbi:polyamine ABC transporter substrate-binding protein [Leeia oryzae]|uniref:polyamine ABC transporter substrate-binding protein n=1 Tax=Leeia oryzae TaxID=356662 RepID=UPI0003A37396|nr:polyamine ABC transporter substrate-binding protein [Leeia oryzae]